MTRLLLCFALLLIATSAYSKNARLEITTNAAGCPIAVTANQPCNGNSEDACFSKGQVHNITWKFKGSNNSAPDFHIEMKNPDDVSIFANGCRSSGKSVSCSITAFAQAGSYGYNVVNSSCRLDPRIIIN